MIGSLNAFGLVYFSSDSKRLGFVQGRLGTSESRINLLGKYIFVFVILIHLVYLNSFQFSRLYLESGSWFKATSFGTRQFKKK